MGKRDQENSKIVKHGPVKTPFSRFLDTNGDGTGTKSANGDYSSTPGRFFIAPEAGEIMRCARMLVCIYDTSGMQAQEYGNIGSALTNGVELVVQRDGVTINSGMDDEPITINAEWGGMCYDVDVKSWGSGNEMLLARWTFTATGSIVRLIGDENDSLAMLFNDDLTGLLAHNFLIQGYYE